MKNNSIRFLTLLYLLTGLIVLACNRQKIPFEKLQQEVLNRIIGTWQVEGEQLFEEWSLSADSSYFATSYSLKNDEKIILESIRLVREKDNIFYEATVLDQNEGKPVRFKLVSLTANKMVFFNPEHDFPKKIEYEILGDHHMMATVSDGKGGKGKSFNIKFERVMKQKKVTGIGGIFFKCDDPAKMRDWYRDNLGLVTNEYGSLFEFRLSDNPQQKGYLQWSPFSANTRYFEPSKKEFMINYRVENMELLVEELRKNGVMILDTIEEYEYGKFIHILDPENNKIELWEPVDNEFTKSYEGETTK